MTESVELTQNIIDNANRTSKFVVDRIRELVDFMIRPGFDFALIINDPKKDKTMAIFSEMETKEQLTETLRLAYTRHNDGSMNDSNDLNNPNRNAH